MEMNYFVILIVAILLMILAMIWFGPLFWNLWMKIHGWENKTKETLKEEEKGMWKLLVIEFIGTFLMVCVLAFFIVQSPAYYELAISFFVWIWFVLPLTISNTIWWGDKKEWWIHKIMILAWFNLVALLIAGFIFSL